MRVQLTCHRANKWRQTFGILVLAFTSLRATHSEKEGKFANGGKNKPNRGNIQHLSTKTTRLFHLQVCCFESLIKNVKGCCKKNTYFSCFSLVFVCCRTVLHFSLHLFKFCNSPQIWIVYGFCYALFGEINFEKFRCIWSLKIVNWCGWHFGFFRTKIRNVCHISLQFSNPRCIEIFENLFHQKERRKNHKLFKFEVNYKI